MTEFVQTPSTLLAPGRDDASKDEQFPEQGMATLETPTLSPVKRSNLNDFNSPNSLDDYINLIGAAWHKVRDGIFDVADLCAGAKDKLGKKSEKDAFVKRLPFSDSTFCKLAKIGGDARFKRSEVRALLPANFSAIYLVSGLKAEEFSAACEEGILHPQMMRKDLVDWQQKRKKSDKLAQTIERFCPDWYHAAILLAPDIDEANGSKVDDLLNQISAVAGASVIWPRDRNAPRIARWHKMVSHKLIVLARKLVREHIASEFAKRRTGNESRAAFLKRRGWSLDDELLLEDCDDEVRIREVLDFIDREDEFDRLKEQAEKLVPFPAALHGALAKVATCTLPGDGPGNDRTASDDLSDIDVTMNMQSENPTVF